MASRRKAGLKVVYRMATGGLVWAVPGTGQQIMWAGPGSALRIGQVLQAGAPTFRIQHPSADGQYRTAKQAAAAARAFLAASGASGDRQRPHHGNARSAEWDVIIHRLGSRYFVGYRDQRKMGMGVGTHEEAMVWARQMAATGTGRIIDKSTHLATAPRLRTRSRYGDVTLHTATLDGKRIGYSSETEFLVQIGKGRGAYRTKYRIVGNLMQAVVHYQGINVGRGHKKRLLMPSSKHPVLAKCCGS